MYLSWPESLICNQFVGGSNPSIGSKKYNIFIKKFAIEKESSLKGRKEIFDKPTVKNADNLNL